MELRDISVIGVFTLRLFHVWFVGLFAYSDEEG